MKVYVSVIYQRIKVNPEIRMPYLNSEGNRKSKPIWGQPAWAIGCSKGFHASAGSLNCLFQDTVVALHALSKYGAATFTRTGKAAEVTIQSTGTFSKKFQVNNDNLLLLQQISLPAVPGEYSITATGKGCVYLQVRFLGTGGGRWRQVGADGSEDPFSLNSPNSADDGASQRKS